MQRTEPWPNEIHREAVRVQGVEMSVRRVRDDVREGVAVAAFSLFASAGLAVLMTLFSRIG